MSPPPAAGTLSPGAGRGTLSPPQQARLTADLDSYSLQLIRSQMDQAQQQAQVATCQVQLLRDQLNAETTARLEAQVTIPVHPNQLLFSSPNRTAQARTNQLLNANKELLDQVSNLVNRMSTIETRIVGDSPYHPSAAYPVPFPPVPSRFF